jgi:hypothetical protein
MVVAFFFIAALVFVAVGAYFNGGHRGTHGGKVGDGRRHHTTEVGDDRMLL